MAMKPHGDVLVEVRDQTVCLHPVGAMNTEFYPVAAERISNAVSRVLGSPWAMYTDLRAWELAEPSFFNQIDGLFDGFVDEGLAMESFVVPSGLVGGVVESTFGYLARLPHQWKLDPLDAWQWIRERGFTAADRPPWP